MTKKNYINMSYKNKLRTTYALLMFVVLILLSGLLYFAMNMRVKPVIKEMGQNFVGINSEHFGKQFEDENKIIETMGSTLAFKNGDMSSIKRDIDNQKLKNGNIILSIKYKAITGEEYDNNPLNIKTLADYESDLLSENEPSLKNHTFFDKKLDAYVFCTGRRIVNDKGKVTGALIINISLKEIAVSLSNTNKMRLEEIWILDSSGNIILNPNYKKTSMLDIEDFKNNVNSSSKGEIKYRNFNGSLNYPLSYIKIPNTENLYLAMPGEHGAYADTLKFLLAVILISDFLISFFIFIAANKITNFVTKPLTYMVEIIENSDGINAIKIPNELKSSKDEIGILSSTIDRMANNIRNNIQKLNDEIKERVKAQEYLTVLNDELERRVQERTKDLTMVTNVLTISEDRFRIAMEASHIGLYDSDLNNCSLVVNGIFLKLLNSPQFKDGTIKESDWVQFVGKLEEYVYEEDIPKLSQICENNISMVGNDFSAEFRLKESPKVWLLFTGQLINEDKSERATRFIGILQDISERKKVEVELKSAKDEAEEANMAKSQFLANMSHEIRTPMNAIMGLAHLVSKSDLDDFQKNYISKIEASSKILLRIINDILDFSKIEARKLEIENIKFNLYKVFENVSSLYTPSASNKGIDINFDIGEGVPDLLRGDPLRLEQIISNLITNAIKFTSKGEINVAVKSAEERADSVKLHFSVSDTGIGIKEDQIQKLFTAFTQADNSTTRKYGGTGLGLTITKQLVELMNGEIWVESQYGEGSTFQFFMTFDKVPDIVKPNYEMYPDLQGKKVLVVDHNKTSLMIIERMLRSFLFDVTAINSPFEVIELLEKNNFDLLIIDFNLPELSGIDLYKRLVVNTEIKVPKTIFISDIGRESFYNQVNQLGVKNFLVKPISQSLMFDAIMDTLKGTATKVINRENDEESDIKFKGLLKDKQILLVEDNDINQLVAKDILEQAGIRVSIANNGEEAIKYVGANKFDAVLMDMQMPVMDGYKATKILRETHKSSELPIIAMTANALTGDREKSIEAGMNDYISKPIDQDILFETLVKWIVGSGAANMDKPVKESSNVKVEILDINRTLVRLGNKQNFYYDLLKRYCDNYSNIENEFSDMMINRQYEDAKRYIHSLKSVTGNIGAMKLNKFIVQFESEYETYTEDVLKEKLEAISTLNEELLNNISKVLLEDNPKEKQLSYDFDISMALNKLLEALQKARAKEIKESMNYLVTNSESTNFVAQINEIKKLVDRYRFKEAKIMLEELINAEKEQNNG